MSVQIFKRSLSYLAITILFGGLFQILQAHETTTQHPFVHTNRQSAVKLARPDSSPSFTFAIFGDRTGTHEPIKSMNILNQAIDAYIESHRWQIASAAAAIQQYGQPVND